MNELSYQNPARKTLLSQTHAFHILFNESLCLDPIIQILKKSVVTGSNVNVININVIIIISYAR